MKVSILIPTLNRLDYLKESLDSARRQTYTDLEILVSDDGSEDGSREYVRATQTVDARVRLLPANPQPGLFNNINYLVQQSRGDAFCILADDDRLLPEFVEKLVGPLLQDEQRVASFCDHWLIDPRGETREADTERNTFIYHRQDLPQGIVKDALTQAMKGSMCMGFSLYRADVFRQELFDLSCGGAADFDYAIRAAQLGPLYYVRERLGEYRVHAASATATRPAYMINGIIRVFSKHSFPQSHHEKMRRQILRSKYGIKALYVCVLDRQEYLRSLREYLKLGGHPLHPKIMVSCLLAALPRAAAARVKSSIKTVALRSHNRLIRAAISAR
jgi:glycosyltransferase involved in cell wall biosynthesis